MASRTSIVARNAAADAQAVLANKGYIRIYTGEQPISPEELATGTLLAELRFGEIAFGPAVQGVLTANEITGDSSADSTGTAGWGRILQSNGTTALWDGNVTVIGGGGQFEFNSLDFQAGAAVDLTSLTVTLPQQHISDHQTNN